MKFPDLIHTFSVVFIENEIKLPVEIIYYFSVFCRREILGAVVKSPK